MSVCQVFVRTFWSVLMAMTCTLQTHAQRTRYLLMYLGSYLEQKTFALLQRALKCAVILEPAHFCFRERVIMKIFPLYR